MTPAQIEALVEQVRLDGAFDTRAALAGPLGAVFGPTPPQPGALPPFRLSRYEGQGLISFTYDDGLLDNFTHAAPLHVAHGVPASFAIIAKRLLRSGSEPGYMTPQMVRILHDLGFEVASHGLLHSKRLRDMTLRELHLEAKLSKSAIERAIGVPNAITSYCIPFSRARALHVDYLHKVYAVVRHAGSTLNTLPLEGRQSVASYPVLDDTSFDTLKALIDTAIETRTALVLMLHGICPDDARPKRFESRARVLERVLDHVASQDPSRLLPVPLGALRQITQSAVRTARRRGIQNSLLRGMRDTWASLRLD